MNKGLSIALLIVGIILLIYGAQASDSLGSGISRLFTGSPTNKTIVLLVSGVIATIAGLFGLKNSR